MHTYYITIAAVALFCYVAQKVDNPVVDELGQVNHSRRTRTMFCVAAGILIFVSGFRYYVGTDFGAYYRGYRSYADSFWDSLKTFEEPGIRLIYLLVVSVGGQGRACVFAAAFVTIGLFLRTIYNNTDRLLFATTLFILSGCWHGSFNGVRQFLAASVLFSGLRYIKEKNFLKYLVVVLIASLFHVSAMITVLFYFIANRKVSFLRTVVLIAGSIIILYSFDRVLRIASIIMGTDFSGTGEYLIKSVNPFRVLTAITPAVFFYIMYAKRGFSQENAFWMNLLIINGITMFATSNSAYLARAAIYTTVYIVLGIPELMKGLSKSNQRVLNIIIPLLYGFYWWYEVSSSGSLNPYRFSWH